MSKSDITPEVIKQKVTAIEAQKINDVIDKIKINVPAVVKERGFIERVKELFAYLLTEETTDEWIEVLTSKLPWGLGWIAKKILDRLLPEHLLSLIYIGLDRLADD